MIMTMQEAQIVYWAEKFFPHLLPSHAQALVRELVKLHVKQP